MSRWGSIKSLADIDRRIRQGRGSGTGEHYRPWVYVREFSSRGRSHIVPGIKIKRDFHLFSDLEAAVFRAVEFLSGVTDIHEQNPLFPYGTTQKIALEIGIRHPRYPRTKLDMVMTSDFVLTWNRSYEDRFRPVISVKYASELKNVRTLEKLELERRYWADRQRPWLLVTERELPRDLGINLKWLRQGALLKPHLGDTSLRDAFLAALDSQSGSIKPLQSVLRCVARRLDISESDAFGLFKHLVWHHQVTIDLRWRLSPIRPVMDMKILPDSLPPYLIRGCPLWNWLSMMS